MEPRQGNYFSSCTLYPLASIIEQQILELYDSAAQKKDQIKTRTFRQYLMCDFVCTSKKNPNEAYEFMTIYKSSLRIEVLHIAKNTITQVCSKPNNSRQALHFLHTSHTEPTFPCSSTLCICHGGFLLVSRQHHPHHQHHHQHHEKEERARYAGRSPGT